VVIGSEGQGVRPEILQQAQQQLIIPMNPRCESLNASVAAAIVMWQMKGSAPNAGVLDLACDPTGSE
jgi:tRNA G18 (ribose-2'-O)-methylase SpoU